MKSKFNLLHNFIRVQSVGEEFTEAEIIPRVPFLRELPSDHH